MNTRILVIGKLIPAANDRYEEAGQIVYTSIQPIDGDPKRVVGTFTCLVHGVPGVASAAECRSVIKTDGGLYWGLESRSLDSVGLSRGLKRGERISLEGELLSDMPEDWRPWAWGSNRIQGVLKVASLKMGEPPGR